ncbi:DUF3103 family protein [Allostreptomyces psammosilenae]|uniref:DUF3103 family protein n=1 Tax=Allostreptomyces psammosilenae TaxID=1892865 RepID=A0A852ZQ08_9ACTN|nr:DUF3103 family protein [Allostreptomyces psammosilenae]NYI04483.1 hypothetical protein [Allostreptomyces psammosilenae]
MLSFNARRNPLRTTGALLAGGLLVCVCAAGTATARPVEATGTTPAATSATTAADAERAARQTARELAASLRDSTWLRTVRAALGPEGEADLLALADRADAPAELARLAGAANRAALAAEGLPADTGSLLQVRLGDESMRAGLHAGRGLLVAAEGSDEATTVVAYDASGREHQLDAHTVPNRPVLVVGVDHGRALDSHLATFRETLREHGVSTSDSTATPATDSARTASTASTNELGALAGYDATRLDSIHLSDDQEPWVRGDAEIYALVAGVSPAGQPQVDTVQLPYLDEDGRTYTPGQILVNWSHFRYDAVDIVLMEEDTGTNYEELARAVAAGLLTVISQTQYVPLVDAVLAAIPDDWWTEDPDYVDSWYTIQKATSGSRVGAAGNGTISLSPIFIPEL